MLVCFANKKGGVGKSTLAVHLAAWLFDRGATVALLDCDQQRSSSRWLAEVEKKVSIETADTPEDVALKVQSLRQCHDFLIGDAPAGIDDRTRTLLILADLVIFPITPSILDLRSVSQATAVLKYAQSINGGRPEGRLVLNRIRTWDTISRQLEEAVPSLGLTAANSKIRDLRAYRDAAQQGTVVTRTNPRGNAAAADITRLFVELMTDKLSFLVKPRNKQATNTEERKSYGRKKIAR